MLTEKLTASNPNMAAIAEYFKKVKINNNVKFFFNFKKASVLYLFNKDNANTFLGDDQTSALPLKR